jgi:hypothetical protein
LKRLSLVLRLSSHSPSRISFEFSLAALEDCRRHRSHKISRPFDLIADPSSNLNSTVFPLHS